MFAYCLNNPVCYIDFCGNNASAATEKYSVDPIYSFLHGNTGSGGGYSSTVSTMGAVFVGVAAMLAVALASEQDYVPEISYDEADVACGPPSPNDDDDDDFDDYYANDSNFGGRQKIGKPKGNAPGNNRAQNKQFRDATKGRLNKDQQRELHNEITGEGLGFRDLLDAAKNIMFFFIGLFDNDDR